MMQDNIEWIGEIRRRIDEYRMKQGAVGIEPKFILMGSETYLRFKRYTQIVEAEFWSKPGDPEHAFGLYIVVSHDLEPTHLSLVADPRNEAQGEGPTDVMEW
jgi:hypothetical protein